MLRFALYHFAPFRRIILSAYAAHLGSISGNALYAAAYNSSNSWISAFHASLVMRGIFDFKSSFGALFVALMFLNHPAILFSLAVAVKLIFSFAVARKWNWIFLTIYLYFISLEFLARFTFYVGNHVPFLWFFEDTLHIKVADPWNF
jgi:hypothetical protein